MHHRNTSKQIWIDATAAFQLFGVVAIRPESELHNFAAHAYTRLCFLMKNKVCDSDGTT